MTTDNIDTRYKVGNLSNNKFFNFDEPISEKLLKIILGLVGTGIDVGVDIVLGTSITNTSVDELKKKLIERLNKVSILAKDPLIQHYVLEASKEVASLTLETLEQLEDPLNKMVERIFIMIGEIGDKALSGSLRTALGIVQAAIAEVPVIGGLIDLATAAGIAFNSSADVIESTVSNALESVKLVNEIVSPTIKKAQNITEKIQQTRANVNQRLEDLTALSKTLS